MQLNDIQQDFINKKLAMLKQSKFRNSFHLRNYMITYIDKNGWDTIENHCHDFIVKRLSIYPNPKDGKQTPMSKHPVFIAQHATGTCCRGCLEKWHHIPKNRNLTEKEIRFIEALIIEWLKIEYKNKSGGNT